MNRAWLGIPLALSLHALACAPSRPDGTWDDARLVATLESGDDDSRRRAAVLLAGRRTPASLWPLTKALGDPRWEVRVAAVEGLERLQDPRADRSILAAARDGHWWVQTTALKALARRRPPGTANAARLASNSDNDAVRAAGRRLAAAVGI